MSTEVLFVGGPAEGWRNVVNVQEHVVVRIWIEGPFPGMKNIGPDHIYKLEHYRLPPDEFTPPREVPVYIHSSLSTEQATPIIESRLGV